MHLFTVASGYPRDILQTELEAMFAEPDMWDKIQQERVIVCGSVATGRFLKVCNLSLNSMSNKYGQ